MAKTPEAKVKAKVTGILKSHKAYFFYPFSGGFGTSGIPDIVGCVNGKFFGIECKAGNNKPTALQLKELRKIMDAGGYCVVVNEDNVEELNALPNVLGQKGK